MLCVFSRCQADVSIAPEVRICRDVEMDLNHTFIKKFKELPSSWAEFTEVKMTNKGTSERNTFRIKTINSFALVPNRPKIKLDSEIPTEYSGKFLYLIGKHEVISKNSGVGRCAILLAFSEKDPTGLVTYSYLIPEDIAKKIIQQIDGFDPEKQPIAFPDLGDIKRIDAHESNTTKNRNLNISNPEEIIASIDEETRDYRNVIIFTVFGGVLIFIFLFSFLQARKKGL